MESDNPHVPLYLKVQLTFNVVMQDPTLKPKNLGRNLDILDMCLMSFILTKTCGPVSFCFSYLSIFTTIRPFIRKFFTLPDFFLTFLTKFHSVNFITHLILSITFPSYLLISTLQFLQPHSTQSLLRYSWNLNFYFKCRSCCFKLKTKFLFFKNF